MICQIKSFFLTNQRNKLILFELSLINETTLSKNTFKSWMTISYFDHERPEKKSCFILHVHIEDVCNTFSYHKWMLISLKECVLLNIQLKLVHTYSVMKYTYRRKVQRRYMTQLFARRTRNILVTKRNFYLHVYRIHVTIVKLSVILICILSNIYTEGLNNLLLDEIRSYIFASSSTLSEFMWFIWQRFCIYVVYMYKAIL